MEDRFAPKFLRRFAAVGEAIKDATASYVASVKERSFPNESESY